MRDKLDDKRFVEHRRYNIKTVWEKHREISRQVILGRSNKEIASDLGITPQTVSNVRNSPLARAELEKLGEARDMDAKSIAQRIEEFAPVALELLENIVKGQVPGASIALRAKVAGDQLGRAGHGEVKRIQSLHAHLSRSDIEKIKARAVENARIAGVIEAEFKDESLC